jgi:hypothetical protein
LHASPACTLVFGDEEWDDDCDCPDCVEERVYRPQSATATVDTTTQPAAVPSILAQVCAHAKFGVAVWWQVDQYLCACTDRTGRIAEPRNWSGHETPELALASLLVQLQQLAKT